MVLYKIVLITSYQGKSCQAHCKRWAFLLSRINMDKLIKELECNKGEISDGYHTFNELYHHRMVLFAVICNSHKAQAWKSKLHHDGTMYDDYFIVGVTTPKGDYTYHYHMDNWDYFDIKELPNAPEWDGHKPSDIDRLLTL